MFGIFPVIKPLAVNMRAHNAFSLDHRLQVTSKSCCFSETTAFKAFRYIFLPCGFSVLMPL